MSTNEDLVSRALRGDQDAYTRLFKNMTPIVERISWRYFKGSADGYDFEFNTMSHILMRLHKFDGKSQFSTWATRVAINQALEFIRRDKHMRNMLCIDDAKDPGDAMSGSFAATIVDKNDAYVSMETGWNVQKMLARLRPGDRDLLMAQVIQGHTLKDLARERKKTIPAIKACLVRAKRNARSILKNL